ncbi:T9SS type A sorting domain-containing protein [Cytophagaceae bacterium ABcell3]|nr:T9SS type A sorting domain-containing protein [Cytophagaceae bacterium ABcell3]
MKFSITTLLILLCFHFSCYSQNWDLFVKNQNSFYQQQYGDSAIVENFLADSSVNIDGISYLYFNTVSEFSPGCRDSIRNFIHVYNYNFFNLTKIDSLVTINDSVFFVMDTTEDVDSFLFMPNSKVGDKWETNGLHIECTSASMGEVLGLQDSVKTFLCSSSDRYEGIEFKLSKSHGLVQFLPFNEFLTNSNSDLPPYYELIGFSRDGIQKGYQQPGFEDYFTLREGDVLLWRHYLNRFGREITTYSRDSIVSTYTSSDTIKYNIIRTTYDNNGSITGTKDTSTTFLKVDEGKILSNNTSWFGLKYDKIEAWGIYFFDPLYIEVQGEDTVTFASYLTPGPYIDTANCSLNVIFDIGYRATFSTHKGMIFRGSSAWGEHSTTLIGSVIDNEISGVMDIPTSVREASPAPEHFVYPNPVNDFLYIVAEGIANVHVYTVSGNLVLSEEGGDKINVAHLKPGLYIVKLIDVHHRESIIKILKE